MRIINALIIVLLMSTSSLAGQIEENTAAYGGIKFNHEALGYVAEIDAAVAGTYYGFINGVVSDQTNGVTFVDDDGNGDYILINYAGNYLTWASVSVGLASPGGEDIHCAVFVNDAKCCVEGHATFITGLGVLSITAIPDVQDLAAGDKVRVKCATDGTSKTIEVYHLGLRLQKVFDTHTRIRDTGTPCYGCLK